MLLLATHAFHAAAAKLSSRHITTSTGLAGNTVNEIVQDPSGYIWLATNNGVSRHDGNYIYNYNRATATRQLGRIGRLTCDTAGNCLWLSTATYTNECYSLDGRQFTEWSSNPNQRLNKFIVTNKGIAFYDNTFGIRTVIHGVVTDYTVANGRLPTIDIRQICEDTKGNLWVATGKGAFVISPESHITKVVSERAILSCAIQESIVMMLTERGEIYRFDSPKERRLITSMNGVSAVNTSFICQRRWFIFTPDNAFAIDTDSGTHEALDIAGGLDQGSTAGYHFISNQSGRLWIFSETDSPRSMKLIENAHFSTNRGRKFHITSDRHGRLFIATYGSGLYVWSPTDNTLEHHTASSTATPLIGSNYLVCAYTDRQGNVWLGTESDGAYCIATQQNATEYIIPEPSRQGDWSNSISAIAETPDHQSIIIGTLWGGLYRYGLLTGKMQKLSSTDARITCVFIDSSGRLWVGTDRQGVRVANTVYDTSSGLPVNNITCLREDSNGRIWIGTYGGGLVSATTEKSGKMTFRQYLSDNMLGSRIKSVAIGRNGSLWAGTFNGLYSTDSRRHVITDSDFKSYKRADGTFPSDEIFALTFEGDTLLAGAAGCGLLKCSIGANSQITDIKSITSKEGLPNDNVLSILTDATGNIWTGTESGIACIGSGNRVLTMPATEAVATELCAVQTSDGRLFFGTTNGVAVIKAPTTMPSAALLQTIVTDIVIGGVSSLDSGRSDTSTYDYNENNLSFLFSCFNFMPSATPLYQYRLDGLDSEYSVPSTISRADYRNLPPGHYTFRVRAMGDNGQWMPAYYYSFTISQPWWNTWWAWLLYTLLIICVGWQLYSSWHERFMIKQQMAVERQANEFRTTLFTNIAHEFRTPIAIIAGAVDKLSADAGNHAAQQSVRRGTDRLLRLVNQFMDYRKLSTGNIRLHVAITDMVPFVRQIAYDFRTMAASKSVTLNFLPDGKQLMAVVDIEKVETICYNLLSNAVKYTPRHGSVTLRMTIDDDMLRITVDDSGPGISDKQADKLFNPFMSGYASQGGMGIGLYNAHQLAAVHKGCLEYAKVSADGGSRFTLTLPCTDAAYTPEERNDNQPAAIDEATVRDGGEIIREMNGEPLNNVTVAIIEDDHDMLLQIDSEVSKFFRTVSYSTGLEGISGIAEDHPQLLLCDVMLPDIDGYEVVRRLKANGDTADIPVIMLTALDDDNHQIRAYHSGADDYVVKPCNFRILLSRIVQLLRKAALQTDEGQNENTTVTGSSQRAATTGIIDNKADKVFIDKLEMVIARYLSDDTFSVDRMAETMNMGRTKFYGKVKEITGMSPNKYLLEKRLKRAAQLLSEGELSVSEVSYKVGITDPSYFNKLFKTRFGTVPSKYGK